MKLETDLDKLKIKLTELKRIIHSEVKRSLKEVAIHNTTALRTPLTKFDDAECLECGTEFQVEQGSETWPECQNCGATGDSIEINDNLDDADQAMPVSAQAYVEPGDEDDFSVVVNNLDAFESDDDDWDVNDPDQIYKNTRGVRQFGY